MMGVYYKIVNLDKQEQIDPGAIGHGTKHPEDWVLPAQMLLMAVGNRWCGDRIELVSDAVQDMVSGYCLYYETDKWRDIGVELLTNMQRYNKDAADQLKRITGQEATIT